MDRIQVGDEAHRGLRATRGDEASHVEPAHRVDVARTLWADDTPGLGEDVEGCRIAGVEQRSVTLRIVLHERTGAAAGEALHARGEAVEPDLLGADAHPRVSVEDLVARRAADLVPGRHVLPVHHDGAVEMLRSLRAHDEDTRAVRRVSDFLHRPPPVDRGLCARRDLVADDRAFDLVLLDDVPPCGHVCARRTPRWLGAKDRTDDRRSGSGHRPILAYP